MLPHRSLKEAAGLKEYLSVVLNQGWLCPLRRHFKISTDMFDFHNRELLLVSYG
jgi:hypothetical protein